MKTVSILPYPFFLSRVTLKCGALKMLGRQNIVSLTLTLFEICI